MAIRYTTEAKKYILLKSKVNDKGYDPSMSADPYYADPSKKIYPKLREIAMKRLKGDKCKTLMIHCGKPVQYTSIASSYWQEHFMAFGRLH